MAGHCVCRKVVKDIYIEILLFAYAKGNQWSELLSCIQWLPGSRYRCASFRSVKCDMVGEG